jgi:hypothetical protein
LSYHVHALHIFYGTNFSISIVSLVILRKFCKYFIGMTEKARRVAAFLSWYR